MISDLLPWKMHRIPLASSNSSKFIAGKDTRDYKEIRNLVYKNEIEPVVVINKDE
jgi:hypothetical protein